MKKLSDEWKIKKNVFKNKSFRDSIDFDLIAEDSNKSLKINQSRTFKACRSPSTSKPKIPSEMGLKRNLSPVNRKSSRLKKDQIIYSSTGQEIAFIQDDGSEAGMKKEACDQPLLKSNSRNNSASPCCSNESNRAGPSKSKITPGTVEPHIFAEKSSLIQKSCYVENKIDEDTCSGVTSDMGYNSSVVADTVKKSQNSPFNKQQPDSSLHNESDSNSSVEKENCCDLSYWGLPNQVITAYKSRNIIRMFQWQYECLSMKDVLNGKNLVYSAPTSAGKTLVAEILMLKKVLETKKKAMMILPFVSVVREKVNYFKEMFQDTGILVDGFMGTHRPPGGFNAVDIAICTIEKANNIINRLMEEKKLDDLGILAVDELHMLGDSSRGYLLELLLTKLLYNCKKHNITIQIIGMSATLPNLNVLSSWLQAELYHTDFRPVPLHEMFKVGPVIYDSKSCSPVRTLSKVDICFTNDSDHTIFLTMETITAGHGVLIFCPSKNWCETLATSLAHEIYKVGRPAQTDHKNPTYKLVGEKLREHMNGISLNEVLIQLKGSPAGLDSVLKVTVPFGVAFHHAGLTFDERDIIEEAFKQGVIKVLVATSTLSSGVNLPARRVLIRSPMFCGSVIDTLSYKQMVGRAGRKGIDDQGESILICKEMERKYALQLVNSDLPPVQSCLMKSGRSGVHASLKRAVIEVIASGAATTHKEVICYGSCTLLFASLVHENCASENSDGNVESSIVRCLDYLLENDFIFKTEKKENGSVQLSYKPSQLGNAVLASGFSPEDALRVLKELQIARRCFVLENDLHLLYEVTPPYLSDQMGSLNWMTFLSLWEQLPEDFRRVGELVGVRESFIGMGVQGRVGLKSAQSYQKLAVHQRFYAALALNDLIQEVPLSVVSQKYNCNKGILQSLQQSTSTFAGMLTIFCNKLGWHNMELLFSSFQKRVHFGIQQELCDLVQLSSLNAQRARLLYNAGFETVSSLAAADPEELELVLCNAGAFESEKQLEGDVAAEALQRRVVKRVQIIGKKGIDEKEAALSIINEAQHFIKYELGINSVTWKKPNKQNISLQTIKIPDTQHELEGDRPVEKVLPVENPPQNNLCVTGCEENAPKISLGSVLNVSVKCNENGGLVRMAANKSLSLNRQLNHDCISAIHQFISKPEKSGSLPLEGDACAKSFNCNQDAVIPENGCFSPQNANIHLKKCDVEREIAKEENGVPIQVEGDDLDTSWQLKMSESGSENEDAFEDEINNKNLNVVQNPAKEDEAKGVSVNKSGLELDDVDNIFQELEKTILELKESKVEPSPMKQKPVDHEITLNQLLLSQCAETGNVYHSESLLREGRKDFSFSEILGKDSAENNALGCLKVEEAEIKYVSEELKDNLKAIFDLSSFIDEKNKSRDEPKDSFSIELPQDPSLSLPLFELENEEALNAGVKNKDNCSSTNCSFDVCSLTNNMTSQSTPKMLLHDKNCLEDIHCNALDSPDLAGDSKFEFSELNIKENNLNASQHIPNFDAPVDERVIIETSGDIFESEGSNVDHPSINEVQGNMEKCPNFERDLFGSCSDDLFSTQTSFDKILEDQCSDNLKASSPKAVFSSAAETEKPSCKSNKESKDEISLASENLSLCSMSDVLFENSGDIFEDSTKSKPISENKEKQTSFSYREHSELFKSWDESKSLCLPPTSKTISDSPKRTKSEDQQVFETPFEELQGVKNESTLNFSTDCLEPSPKKCHLTSLKSASVFKPSSANKSKELKNCPKRQLFQSAGLCKTLLKKVDFTNEDKSVVQNIFSIVDVVDIECFLKGLEKIPMFSFAVACEKTNLKKAMIIGPPKLRGRKNSTVEKLYIDEEIFISGLSFCWCEKAYFIDFTNGLSSSDGSTGSSSIDKVLKCLQDLFLSFVGKTIVIYDLKSHCRVLWRGCNLQLAQNKGVSYFDPSIAAWLLNPSEGQQSLQELVTAYWTDSLPIIEGFDNSIGSFGLQHRSSVNSRQRASTEAYITFNLSNILLTYLNDKKLYKSFVDIEMPSVLVLSKMEQSGLGFDLKLATNYRKDLQKKQDTLLKKAHQLAGRKFNIMSSRDLSRILYKELKLNPPDLNYSPMASKHLTLGVVTRSGGRGLPPELKTNKECLEKIMHLHPLPKTVVGWRKLSFAITKVLMPLLRENKLDTNQKMHRLYSTCFIYTVTGRVNMHTPNLQFVPRDFSVEDDSPPPINDEEDYFPISDDVSECGVSLRNMFIASEGYVLLSADYSQLELRILAHLSGDAKLRKSLNSGNDIFKQIAATWKNIPADSVDVEVRQQAKRICYGIIYGMSARSLSHQLKTSESEAAIFMDTFKASYPGVTNYLISVTESCRSKGYVTTLMGRRRYLPNITSQNRGERAHAERQAINTTIQGSAADIIKRSMIEIDNQLEALIQNSSQFCKGARNSKELHPKPGFLVLQLHDELIYEVFLKELERVKNIVKSVMENSTKLSVVLPVNMHVGSSWGSMEDI